MSARWEKLWEDTHTEAYNKGIKEGRNEGGLVMLFGLVGKGRLTLAEASEEAFMSETAFKEKMAEHQRS